MGYKLLCDFLPLSYNKEHMRNIKLWPYGAQVVN